MMHRVQRDRPGGTGELTVPNLIHWAARYETCDVDARLSVLQAAKPSKDISARCKSYHVTLPTGRATYLSETLRQYERAQCSESPVQQ